MAKSWFSEGDEYAYSVAVFMPSLSKAARAVASEMSQAGGTAASPLGSNPPAGAGGGGRRPDDKLRQGPSGVRDPG